MRVRRSLLFWGLLLIPLGAIPLLVRAGQLDATKLADAWRLWPLIVIGVGLLVLLSRTRWAVVGTVVIALTIGSIGGAALASGNIFLGAIGACGIGGNATQHLDRTGTFGDTAALRLELSCGSLNLRTGSGSDWSLKADYRGPAPTIDATSGRLDIRTPSGADRRQDWTMTVPAGAVQTVDLSANAATTTVDLTGAEVDDLSATINAGDLRIVSGEAGIHHVDLTMNAGRGRVTLGGGETNGTISVNAGAIDLCVPADIGLRLDVEDQLTFATNLSSRGLSRAGNVWSRPATSAGNMISLSVEGNAASFNLDPNGGC